MWNFGVGERRKEGKKQIQVALQQQPKRNHDYYYYYEISNAGKIRRKATRDLAVNYLEHKMRLDPEKEAF